MLLSLRLRYSEPFRRWNSRSARGWAEGKMGVPKIAAAFGVGSGTVQRVKAEMRAVAATD
jgi:hypothetical protein